MLPRSVAIPDKRAQIARLKSIADMQKRLQALLDENRQLRRSIDFVSADDPAAEPGPLDRDPAREPVKGPARRKRREPPRS